MVSDDLPVKTKERLVQEKEIGGLPYRRLDISWNGMTVSAIKRRYSEFFEKSRDSESLVSTVLFTLNNDPTEVRDCLKGARNAVSGRYRYWEICLDLIEEGRERLWKDHGIYLSGVVEK